MQTMMVTSPADRERVCFKDIHLGIYIAIISVVPQSTTTIGSLTLVRKPCSLFGVAIGTFWLNHIPLINRALVHALYGYTIIHLLSVSGCVHVSYIYLPSLFTLIAKKALFRRYMA